MKGWGPPCKQFTNTLRNSVPRSHCQSVEFTHDVKPVCHHTYKCLRSGVPCPPGVLGVCSPVSDYQPPGSSALQAGGQVVIPASPSLPLTLDAPCARQTLGRPHSQAPGPPAARTLVEWDRESGSSVLGACVDAGHAAGRPGPVAVWLAAWSPGSGRWVLGKLEWVWSRCRSACCSGRKVRGQDSGLGSTASDSSSFFFL